VITVVRPDDSPEDAAQTVGRPMLHAGDLGVVDDRGRVWVTDRLKDLIIRGGDNIAPAEVESRLVEHELVCRATMSPSRKRTTRVATPFKII
jgi:fatty-acyl-CoA synthase